MPKPEIKEFNELCKEIGMVVITWGIVDQATALTTAMVYNFVPNAKTEPQIPRMFSRRLRYLRKTFNNSPDLSELADLVDSLVTKTLKYKEKRENLVHGLLHIDEPITEKFQFQNLKILEDDITAEMNKFDLKDFPDLVSKIEHLARVWGQVALFVALKYRESL